MSRLCVLLLALSSWLAAPRAGAGEPAPPAAKVKAPRLDLVALKRTLETGDEAAILAGLQELAVAKGQKAAPDAAVLVNELLARGSSVTVALAALELAGELAVRSSSPVAVTYLRHRVLDVRRAAAAALARIGGPEAVAGLRAALHDGDPRVRAAAATGLGTLKATEAVGDLFRVLYKPQAACDCAQGDARCRARCENTGGNSPEAAVAIGLLCAPVDCEKLVDLLGKLPFELVGRGLESILLRPEAEVSERYKLDVIERIGRLQTDAARVLLRTVRARYPEKGSAHVRLGLDAAIDGKPVPRPKP
jgi:hypothetical protein